MEKRKNRHVIPPLKVVVVTNDKHEEDEEEQLDYTEDKTYTSSEEEEEEEEDDDEKRENESSDEGEHSSQHDTPSTKESARRSSTPPERMVDTESHTGNGNGTSNKTTPVTNGTCSSPLHSPKDSSSTQASSIFEGRAFPKKSHTDKPEYHKSALGSSACVYHRHSTKPGGTRTFTGVKRSSEFDHACGSTAKKFKNDPYKFEEFYLDSRDVETVDLSHPNSHLEIMNAIGICPSQWKQCAKNALKKLYGHSVEVPAAPLQQDVLDWMTAADRAHTRSSIKKLRNSAMKALNHYTDACVKFGKDLQDYRERKLMSYVEAEMKYRHTKESDPTGDVEKLHAKHMEFVRNTAGISSVQTFQLLRKTLNKK